MNMHELVQNEPGHEARTQPSFLEIVRSSCVPQKAKIKIAKKCPSSPYIPPIKGKVQPKLPCLQHPICSRRQHRQAFVGEQDQYGTL